MQGHPINNNLFRKSYGFQSNNLPIFKNNNHPVSPPIHYPKSSQHIPQDTYHSSIKQMENKLESFQQMFKNKYPSPNPNSPPYTTQLDKNNSNWNQQQFLKPELLRGSCQDVIKSFDYYSYKNGQNLNAENKNQQPKDMRRFPATENKTKSSQIVRKNTGQSQQTVNEPEIQKKGPGFMHKMSPSKNLTKFFNDKQIQKKSLKQLRKSPEKVEQDLENIFKSKQEIREIKTQPQISSMTQIEISKEKKKFNEYLQLNNSQQKLQQRLQKGHMKHSKVINGFEFGPILGRGKFGQVFLARHHEVGFLVAIKKIFKSKIQQFKMLNQFIKQIRLHSCLDHPNIVKFYGIFEQGESIYLVMEYLNGGTLFDYLNDVNALSVKQAAQFLKDVIEALNYMHEKCIAHRDIKPENIVISSEKVAKLCDFGWSALVQTSRKTYCGTLDYAPPEILQRKDYDLSVDIWCIGVLTYELLTGKIPFEAKQRSAVRDKIINVDKMKIDYPSDFPLQAKQFIEALVQKDPASRPKCHQLLKFNLFTMHLHKGMKTKRIQ